MLWISVYNNSELTIIGLFPVKFCGTHGSSHSWSDVSLQWGMLLSQTPKILKTKTYDLIQNTNTAIFGIGRQDIFTHGNALEKISTFDMSNRTWPVLTIQFIWSIITVIHCTITNLCPSNALFLVFTFHVKFRASPVYTEFRVFIWQITIMIIITHKNLLYAFSTGYTFPVPIRTWPCLAKHRVLISPIGATSPHGSITELCCQDAFFTVGTHRITRWAFYFFAH